MALLGNAAVIILFDRAPNTMAEFYDWHDREHMPERLDIPGFLRGRRFRATRSGPEFLTLYEATNMEVLTGPDYLARLNNPTPQSRRVGPLARNNSRGTCAVEFSTGVGCGGTLLAIRFATRPGEEDHLRNFLQHSLAVINAQRGIAGVHWCKTDSAASSQEVEERRNRVIHIPSSFILIEGHDADVVEAARDRHLDAATLCEYGAVEPIEDATYVLQLSLIR